jgi:hypothetical protein
VSKRQFGEAQGRLYARSTQTFVAGCKLPPTTVLFSAADSLPFHGAQNKRNKHVTDIAILVALIMTYY